MIIYWFILIQETNAKFSKFKLQAKAKITSLNAQIQDLKKNEEGGVSAKVIGLAVYRNFVAIILLELLYLGKRSKSGF